MSKPTGRALIDNIDDFVETAEDLPFLKRLEFDKIFTFIKLMFAAPAVGMSFAGVGWMTFSYISNKEDVYLIVGGVFVLMFLGSLALFSWLNLQLERIDSEKQKRLENYTLVKTVMLSQEGLRNEWHNGWRSIQLNKFARLFYLFDKIIKSTINDKDKITMIELAIDESKEVEKDYIDLFPHITNDFKDFQLGMKKPPTTPDTTAIDHLYKLVKQLQNIDNMMDNPSA